MVQPSFPRPVFPVKPTAPTPCGLEPPAPVGNSVRLLSLSRLDSIGSGLAKAFQDISPEVLVVLSPEQVASAQAIASGQYSPSDLDRFELLLSYDPWDETPEIDIYAFIPATEADMEDWRQRRQIWSDRQNAKLFYDTVTLPDWEKAVRLYRRQTEAWQRYDEFVASCQTESVSDIERQIRDLQEKLQFIKSQQR